jgi:hypothetical protein
MLTRAIRRLPRNTVPPMFAADEPTTSGPRKDDVPTRDADDYRDAGRQPGTPGKPKQADDTRQ